MNDPKLIDRLASLHHHKNAELGLGRTVEQGTVRIHRYMDHIVVTDLTNAGKRGKKVDVASLIPRGHGEKPATMIENWSRVIEHFGESFDRVVNTFRDMLHDYPDDFVISMSQQRGVDVIPAGFAPLDLKGKNVSVRVTMKDFSVKNTGDPNETTCIPALSGGTKEIPVFYRWVRDNSHALSGMTFDEVRKQMHALGLKYHEYCAMD